MAQLEEQLYDTIHHGNILDVAHSLPDKAFHAIITSPPYYKMRTYSSDPFELGQESSPQLYITHLVRMFDVLRPALKDNGTLWIVIGDKTMYGRQLLLPERLAMELELDGWYFHQEIHWYKNNIMTSSYKNSFIRDYEKIIWFSKKKHYYFQHQYEPYSEETIKQFGKEYHGKAVKNYKEAGAPDASETKTNIYKTLPKMPPIGGVKSVGLNNTYSGNTPMFNFGRGRLMRATWCINTQQYHGAHFAVFPIPLVERIIHSCVPFKYCTTCGKAMSPKYTEWAIATRPGHGRKSSSKSGTDGDPHKGLHISELSTKRLKFMRYLTGYERQCEHQSFAHGAVLDPFMGVASTAIAALNNGRHYAGIEISQKYIDLANERIALPKYKKNYYDFISDTWQSRLEYYMHGTNT